MGTTEAVHPADPILQAYGLGKLDDAWSASVSKHLEGCDSCQRRVGELSSDEFLNRLQAAKGTPGSSPDGGTRTDGLVGPVGSPQPADTLPPELVDHADWEIIRELGRGGMGVVYLAKNRLMGRMEVLKVVGRHLIERPGIFERFLREIQAAARLQHVNIVTAYTAVRLGSSLVFAMEYVDGLDLARMVKTKGPLSIAHAAYFIHQVALGLQHAHERGMVHRDIKPANLILARDGKKPVVKVLDFGLAKVTSEGQTDSNLTREGQMVGTPDFIAPEQIRDAKSADIRADIYSLGCTLYCLLSGSPPFRGEHVWDVYQAHFSIDAGPLNLVRPGVPVELATVVAKMMAKEPGRRFQSPEQVAQALTPFFKKANSTTQGSDTEVSQMGRPTQQANPTESPTVSKQPTASPAPAVEALPRPQRTEPKWESLIEFKETEPLTEVVPRLVATKTREKPTWLRPVGRVAVLLCGFFTLLFGILIVFKTPDGNLVLENVPDDALVEVDGKKYTVTPAVGKPIEIHLKPGPHGVVVKRGGVELTGESVVIESGKNLKLTVRREPAGTSTRPTREPKDLPRRTVEPSLPVSDRSQFTVVAGNWSVDGGELIQSGNAESYSELLFGDDRWTDYDFTVDAMRAGNWDLFSLLFRGTGPENVFDYTVAGNGNKTCYLYAQTR